MPQLSKYNICQSSQRCVRRTSPRHRSHATPASQKHAPLHGHSCNQMALETWSHECISGMHVFPAIWAAQLPFTSTEPTCEAANPSLCRKLSQRTRVERSAKAWRGVATCRYDAGPGGPGAAGLRHMRCCSVAVRVWLLTRKRFFIVFDCSRLFFFKLCTAVAERR